MTQISLPNNWVPREYQKPAWKKFESGVRRFSLCWHRRAGKDDFALNITAIAANDVGVPGSIGRIGNYWHMLPEASQARKAIWDAVDPHTGIRRIDQAFPKEVRDLTREHEMFIRFKNGSTWQVVGSDNFNSLVGSPPVGVVFSEYALADPAAWNFLRPILAENGGWSIFISTPRGMNHFGRQLDMAMDPANTSWYGEILTVEDTGVLSLELIDQERREIAAERGEEEAEAIIQQEYYCSRSAAIPGAYFGPLMSKAEKEGRVGDFPWVPSLPVGTAWDIGINDATAIWFYQIMPNDRIRIIDFYQASNIGLPEYAKWLHSRPYVYVEFLWPHDGKQREWAAGMSRPKQAKKYGLNPTVLPQIGFNDGIHQARMVLPNCEFNTTPIPAITKGIEESHEQAKMRMARGLDALRTYHRKWDEEAQTYSDREAHDWASHPASAFKSMACGMNKNKHRNWSPINLSAGMNIPGIGPMGRLPETAIMD